MSDPRKGRCLIDGTVELILTRREQLHNLPLQNLQGENGHRANRFEHAEGTGRAKFCSTGPTQTVL